MNGGRRRAVLAAMGLPTAMIASKSRFAMAKRARANRIPRPTALVESPRAERATT